MGNGAGAAILGLGSYVPERKLTNQDLEKTLETTDEWISKRTGIKCRRIAAPEQAASDLGVPAARRALADAGVEPEELDLIVVATATPDYPFPATACVLQAKLGLAERGIGAFDVSAACTGFIYGLATARAFVESGQARNVLLVGTEVYSRVVDYRDRSSCILFGDAAGAVVVGAASAKRPGHGIRSVRLWADGRGADQLLIPGGGSARPCTAEVLARGEQYLRLNGREIFRFAVGRLVEMIKLEVKAHGLTAGGIGRIIPHQANTRILKAAVERLDLPLDLFFNNVADYGNTSAASIPLALDEAQRAGRLPAGKAVILAAFGGGLTWGSAVIEW